MKSLTQSTVLAHVALFALFVVHLTHIASCKPSTSVEMIPNGGERIVNEGTLKITCRIVLTDYVETLYTYGKDVKWTLPDVYSDNKLKIDYHYDRQTTTGPPPYNITITSTLTVHNATSKETGYYSCAKTGRTNATFSNQTQYIYVKGGDYITLASYRAVLKEDVNDAGDSNNQVFQLEADKGTDVVIPLKTTHPDVRITLQYRKLVMIETTKNTMGETFGDILDSDAADSKCEYKYNDGFIIRNVSPSDSGVIAFQDKLKNTTVAIHVVLIVKGIDLTVIGGNNEIEEGSNVTLACFGFSNFTNRPIWRFGKTRKRVVDIDEEHPPEELEWLRVNITHKALEKEPQVSTLQLFNVTRLIYYNYFECTAVLKLNNRVHKQTSNRMSIRLKSKQKEIEIVEIEVGKAKTINCATTESDDNFQWFKDNTALIEGGQVAELVLKGVPGEIGLYECEYSDEFRSQQKRAFVVKMHDSSTKKTTLVVSLIVVTLIAVVIGLLWFYRSRRIIFRNAEKLLEGKDVNTKNDATNTENESETYAAQPYDKQWEFPRNRLKLCDKEIGAGFFGRVIKGEATDILGTGGLVTTVAVKMIKSRNSDAYRELESLVAELKILIYLGSHVNIVGLLGACTKNITRGELFVILEYCRFGNLKSFLNDTNHEFINAIDDGYVLEAFHQEQRIRCSGYLPMGANEDQNPPSVSYSRGANGAQLHDGIDALGKDVPHPPPTFYWCNQRDGRSKITYSALDLISWSWQLTRGMGHLANNKVVHGDLAARNVLLTDNGVVKVADFGLAHRTYYKEYFQKEEKGPVPMKWMAIESLANGLFTSQSDVWSYGVTLWELFSLGKVPYPGIECKRMLSELESGYRMEKPTDAPDFIGEMMSNCWKRTPKERPTFKQLENTLFQFVHPSARSYYLQLGLLKQC